MPLAALPASPWRDASLALLILGFGLKIGLVPGHVWMPLAYTAAPIPAAAVLSGAAVKAGVIGFIRFLPLGVAMPEWGEALAAAGLFSAFYGVLIGITQKNPKTVLAYSSISQMGLLAAALGMGLATGDIGTAPGAGFSAAHHVLVKGGSISRDRRGRRRWTALVAGADPGSGAGAGPRGIAPNRRRAGEARAESSIRRWHRRHARDRIGGGEHIADAPFSALFGANLAARVWGGAPCRTTFAPGSSWLLRPWQCRGRSILQARAEACFRRSRPRRSGRRCGRFS